MTDWQNPLFGCFNNFGLCAITYFVPCLTAGKNAEAVGQNCLLYGFLAVLFPIGVYTRATTRTKIRESKTIPGTFPKDCLLHWFCPLCALIQEAQEVQGTSVSVQSMARD